MSTLEQKTKKKALLIQDIGLTSYREGIESQYKSHKRVCNNPSQGQVLFLEHEKVITVGSRGKRDEILASDSDLLKHGVSLEETDRGGQVTVHNKGQLIAYFIISLRRFDLKPVDFVRILENCIIDVLKYFGIKSRAIKGKTGVWTESKEECSKIAAIGLRVSNGVTLHGFALNVNNDLDLFNYIIPCGLPGSRTTSMREETSQTISIQQVRCRFEEILRNYFNCEVRIV